MNNGAVDMQVRLLLVGLGRQTMDEVGNCYCSVQVKTDNS